MKVYNSITELIGNTPLLKLNSFSEKYQFKANLYAKLEGMNPAGSAKDRVALQMILDAEKDGRLKKGSVIIEPTSGNTGIGLAAVGVSRGYEVILTMPDTMSAERIQLIKAYGAKVILTPGALGMKGAIAEAERLAGETEGAFIAGQFDNPSNPKAHYLTTGPEIYDALDGRIDLFIAGAGTGGTLSGAGKYLKEKNKDTKIIAVEPSDSPVISGGKAGPHKIQGIGAGFIPKNLDVSLLDSIVCVHHEDAYEMGRSFAKSEGLLVGISSGAALYAAVKEAQKDENTGKNIVVLLTDTGDRYLSTPMFS